MKEQVNILANSKTTAKADKNKKSSSGKNVSKKASADKNTAQIPASLRNEIQGVILIFTGLFLLFSVLTKSDALIVKIISGIIVPFFGTVGSVIFAGIVTVQGICTLFDLESFTKNRAGVYVYILYTNLLILMSLNSPLTDSVSFNPNDILSVWKSTSSGGTVGVILAKVLTSLLSKTGAILLIIAITLVSFIMIFRKSISGVVKEKAHELKEKGEILAIERKTNALQRREELQEQKLLKKEALALMEEEKKQRNIDDFVNRSSVRKAKSEDTVILAEDTAQKETPKNEESAKPQSDFQAPAKRKSRKLTNGINEEKEIYAVVDDTATDILPHEDETVRSEIIISEPKKIKQAEVTKDMITADDDGKKEKSQYVFPSMDLLSKPSADKNKSLKEDSLKNAALLEKTLSNFGIAAKVNQVSMGPTVTRYEFNLTQPGVRVSKILGLSDDIALAFAAKSVRIEAPIPGKNAIGVEVPNKTQTTVHLSELLSCEEFQTSKSPLSIALGKTITGEPLICDITKMPHLLIAGKTGSGKSVCINTIIMSILYHSSPDDVRMILIDPKMVELNAYNQIPYLLVPVVTDPQEASGALNWAVSEMQQRYEAFAKYKVKNIEGYNNKMLSLGEEKMYHVIIIIDELNDLMMAARQSVEAAICRLAQLARAAGIHLVLATQRPSVDVITGIIKANIPTRIAFSVSSQIDSKTILDHAGAEKLIGKGDLLYYPEGIRAQCAYVSEEEVESVVEFIKSQCVAEYDEEVYEDIKSSAETGNISTSGAGSSAFMDDLLPEAMDIAFEKMIISTSTIQRRLRIGYARAGRIIDEMEERGFVSSQDGSKPRNVLIGKDEFLRILNGNEVCGVE